MKKYIQSIMAFAAIVSFASCSSEDNTTIENESATKVMTFTATQEGDEASTKATLSGTYINWESEDKISLLYGSENKQLTLTGGAGSTSGKFSGEAEQSTSYTAVYPFQSTASLSGNDVTNVTLPATQSATDNSFDKNAALMMAQSNSSTLNFKNVVGYVKVKPKFACSKIVLQAANSTEYLAGKCTLLYDTNSNIPSIAFTSEQSTSITLSGTITANTAYYIAVPAVTLSAGWSISFTDNTGDVYTRTGSKKIEFKRNTIINLGEFSRTDNNLKLTLKENGIVPADKQVDMGVFTIGGKNYRVIFAKSNLTTTGLAENESDYGDYFAWGAIKPWYTKIDKTSSPWTATWEKTGGYTEANAPELSKTYYKNNVLSPSDDTARKILGGDWQLPTNEIWNTTNYDWVWTTTQDGYNGCKVTSKSDNSKTIFLPAAGRVNGTLFDYVGSCGYYWSGTANKDTYVYYLYFKSSYVSAADNLNRCRGLSVRPVRLVAVD